MMQWCNELHIEALFLVENWRPWRSTTVAQWSHASCRPASLIFASYFVCKKYVRRPTVTFGVSSCHAIFARFLFWKNIRAFSHRIQMGPSRRSWISFSATSELGFYLLSAPAWWTLLFLKASSLDKCITSSLECKDMIVNMQIYILYIYIYVNIFLSCLYVAVLHCSNSSVRIHFMQDDKWEIN